MKRQNVDSVIKSFGEPIAGSSMFTRQEVVRCEIESAIRNYLLFQDIVSAHLLASAAVEVMHGFKAELPRITSKRFMDKVAGQVSNPGNFARLRELIDAPYNFLKHGSTDRDIELPLHPHYAAGMMMMAITDYHAVFGEQSELMISFKLWFILRNPNAFKDERLPHDLIKTLALDHLPLDEAINVGVHALADNGLFMTLWPQLPQGPLVASATPTSPPGTRGT